VTRSRCKSANESVIQGGYYSYFMLICEWNTHKRSADVNCPEEFRACLLVGRINNLFGLRHWRIRAWDAPAPFCNNPPTKLISPTVHVPWIKRLFALHKQYAINIKYTILLVLSATSNSNNSEQRTRAENFCLFFSAIFSNFGTLIVVEFSFVLVQVKHFLISFFRVLSFN